MRKLYRISGEYCGHSINMLFDCNPSIVHDILLGKNYPILLQSAAVVVDIGANVGAFSKLMSLTYPTAKIHAFEPDPDTCRIFAMNFHGNGNVTAHNVGLFSNNAKAKFFRHADDSTSNSFVHTSGDAIIVTVRKADEALRELKLSTIDILKIDAEFCDYQILSSIMGAGFEPKIIHIEYHTPEDRDAILALLKEKYQVVAGGDSKARQGEFTFRHAEH